MQKLMKGIAEFREKIRPQYKDTFARLALGQKPDALFICCSDSRVAPNVFASTDPGDLFVLRNVGNIICPAGEKGRSEGDVSEAAAIEFALQNLEVRNIIVCGHSECGAMIAVAKGREKVGAPHLRSWLRNAEHALSPEARGKLSAAPKELHNEVSQVNVLEQLEHLQTYPAVRERLAAGTLALHGWWFEIAQAEVSAYDPDQRRFVTIDEAYVNKFFGEITAPA